MLVALGFALALTIVLLVARGFWSMAMRLGARRQAKQVPTAMLELQADRDRLRAEHAMMSRKLELRLEDIKTRMTEQMAEVSRHRNRVQSMTTELEHRDETIKTRGREVAALNAQLDVHRADLSASSEMIDKLASQLREKENELAQQAENNGKLSAELRLRPPLLSNLAPESQPLLNFGEQKPPQFSKQDNTGNRLMQRVAELTTISTQMMNHRDGNPMLPAAVTTPVNDVSPAIFSAENTARQPNYEDQMKNDDQQAAALTEQLKGLEASMSADLTSVEHNKKSGPMANVISLAQRIRALQKKSSE